MRDSSRYSRRLLPLALGVPTVVALASAVVLLLALPGLPSHVGMHWSAGGTADRDAPPAVALLALPLAVGFGLLAWSVLRVPENVRGAAAPRLLTAGSVFFGTVLSVGLTGSVLSAARSGGAFPWAALAVAFVLGLLLAAGAAALLPAPPHVAARSSAVVDPLPLGGSERAIWVGAVAPSPVVAGSLVAVAAVLAAPALVLTVAVGPASLLLLIPALATVAASAGWRVRIDDRGVLVRGLLPPVSIRVRLDELSRVRTTTVAPVSDFGGWGLRMGHGATALVSRAGEALELERTEGRPLVLTVNGAAEAAALLTALIARHGQGRTVPQGR